MRSHGRVCLVEMPLAARVQLLLEDYDHFASSVDRFCELLHSMVELRGHETVTGWQAAARQGRWAEVFEALVRDHYDPLYLRSMDRNYAGMAQALPVALADGTPLTLQSVAQGLIAKEKALCSDAQGPEIAL